MTLNESSEGVVTTEFGNAFQMSTILLLTLFARIFVLDLRLNSLSECAIV